MSVITKAEFGECLQIALSKVTSLAYVSCEDIPDLQLLGFHNPFRFAGADEEDSEIEEVMRVTFTRYEIAKFVRAAVCSSTIPQVGLDMILNHLQNFKIEVKKV
jgi:hypothetical protein